MNRIFWLPGGQRNSNGSFEYVTEIGVGGAEDVYEDYAHSRPLFHDQATLNHYVYQKEGGFLMINQETMGHQ